MRILIAVLFMAGAAWAQEGGEKGKETPKPKAEGGAEGAGGAGFLTLDQVDSNGDGKVTRAELEAALKKLAPARGDKEGGKEGGKKAPRPEGGKEGGKEGDKKAPPKPEGNKEGGKEGDKKAPPKPEGNKEGDK